MFVKVFAQILDSTIAEDYRVRLVFEDLLKLADRDGIVDMTPGAIARRTNVPIDLVTYGIDKLLEPDPASRSSDEDGRRIIPIDPGRTWGWRIVNYSHYRNIRDEEARKTYFRERKRDQRAKSKNVLDSQIPSTDVHGSPSVSTQAEADVEAKRQNKREGEKKPPTPKALRPEMVQAKAILERCEVAADGMLIDQTSRAIKFLSKGRSLEEAARLMEGRMRNATERMVHGGEPRSIRFWLEDSGWARPAPGEHRLAN